MAQRVAVAVVFAEQLAVDVAVHKIRSDVAHGFAFALPEVVVGVGSILRFDVLHKRGVHVHAARGVISSGGVHRQFAGARHAANATPRTKAAAFVGLCMHGLGVFSADDGAVGRRGIGAGVVARALGDVGDVKMSAAAVGGFCAVEVTGVTFNSAVASDIDVDFAGGECD